MDKLEELQYKELIRTCRYWKDEYELKKLMAISIEAMFNNALEEFLEKNPDIKDKWEKFIETKSKQLDVFFKEKFTENNIEENKPITKFSQILETSVLTPKQKELKRIYREIVKLTHPDKMLNHSENDKERRLVIYQESKEFYKNNDLSNIIYCADELGIKYDISLVDLEIIKKDIDIFKQKTMMYEKATYWKWYNDNKDESIINNFVKQQM